MKRNTHKLESDGPLVPTPASLSGSGRERGLSGLDRGYRITGYVLLAIVAVCAFDVFRTILSDTSWFRESLEWAQAGIQESGNILSILAACAILLFIMFYAIVRMNPEDEWTSQRSGTKSRIRSARTAKMQRSGAKSSASHVVKSGSAKK